MRTTMLTIAAASLLASTSAWAGTTTCQHLGAVVTCSDGTTAMPLGDSVGQPKAPAAHDVIPGQGDPHKPGFDPSAVKFHDFHPEMLQSKPLGGDKHSMNEIHDHRAVQNDVNIHIAGGFPVEKTMRPLDRPRNADLIRNTSSYAA